MIKSYSKDDFLSHALFFKVLLVFNLGKLGKNVSVEFKNWHNLRKIQKRAVSVKSRPIWKKKTYQCVVSLSVKA